MLLILWLAFRSLRPVLAVAITLAIGLVTTAGLAFLIGGVLNPVSTAFAVLLVGLGADFSVQLNMRYRAQRHERRDFSQAIREAAEWVGVPLTLAAAACTLASAVLFQPALMGEPRKQMDGSPAAEA